MRRAHKMQVRAFYERKKWKKYALQKAMRDDAKES